MSGTQSRIILQDNALSSLGVSADPVISVRELVATLCDCPTWVRNDKCLKTHQNKNYSITSVIWRETYDTTDVINTAVRVILHWVRHLVVPQNNGHIKQTSLQQTVFH